MFGWLWLILVGAVMLIWLALVVPPSRRRNLTYRLEADAAGTPAPGEAASGGAPIGGLPRVAIVCPGRNEAAMIVDTLPRLCAQDYADADGPRYRVIYVDDHSGDGTPAVTAQCAARFAHLRVLRNEQDPPRGWVGKCWAVHRGYQMLCELEREGAAPRADWLCFTDADIHWNAPCLRRAMEHAVEHGADVVTLFPRLEFGSIGEALMQSQMVLAIGTLFPFEKAMDPKHPDTITGGAFILVRRELYERIGGHRAVAGEVVEDLQLGRKLKAAGGRVRLALTRSLMWCRMYEGWTDMWEGLTKNAYAGMGYRWWMAAFFLAAATLINVITPLYLPASLAWSAMGGGAAALAAAAMGAVSLAAQVKAMNTVRRAIGLPWPYALSMPLGSLIYVAIIVASVWRYYRGGNVWKGRAYGPEQLKTGQA